LSLSGLSLKDRIGVDIGRKLGVEEGLAWAAANGVKYVDFQVDRAPNAMEDFTPARCAAIRETAAAAGIHVGLHTLSAVNIAEFSPHLRDAADRYLESYIDIASMLGASWVEVHGGYHFTADIEDRMAASLARLERAVAYAEDRGVLLLLENMNREPDDAEVHYLGNTLAQCRVYFDRLQSPNLRWAFTVNHAHMEPEGIHGFIDGLDFARCEEVRLADSLGDKEDHLQPGDGNIDFRAMFERIEGVGFTGHYMNAFGTLDDMLLGRDYLVGEAGEGS
jgi:sugar phosphate isomerase/epimerase